MERAFCKGWCWFAVREAAIRTVPSCTLDRSLGGCRSLSNHHHARAFARARRARCLPSAARAFPCSSSTWLAATSCCARRSPTALPRPRCRRPTTRRWSSRRPPRRSPRQPASPSRRSRSSRTPRPPPRASSPPLLPAVRSFCDAAPAAAVLPVAGGVASRRVRAHRARGAVVVGRGPRGHASAARRLGGVRGRGGVKLRQMACGPPPAQGRMSATADEERPGAPGCSKCLRALTKVTSYD
jgi:hypothetical protein